MQKSHPTAFVSAFVFDSDPFGSVLSFSLLVAYPRAPQVVVLYLAFASAGMSFAHFQHVTRDMTADFPLDHARLHFFPDVLTTINCSSTDRTVRSDSVWSMHHDHPQVTYLSWPINGRPVSTKHTSHSESGPSIPGTNQTILTKTH